MGMIVSYEQQPLPQFKLRSGQPCRRKMFPPEMNGVCVKEARFAKGSAGKWFDFSMRGAAAARAWKTANKRKKYILVGISLFTNLVSSNQELVCDEGAGT